jgi:hypothetical protein
MKQLKRLFAVTLLVLALGIPAYAGQIDTPGHTDPPPPPPSASVAGEIEIPSTEPVPGDISSPGMEEIALDMFLSALSLF